MIEEERERFVAKLREMADAIEELSWEIDLPHVEFSFHGVNTSKELAQLSQFLSEERLLRHCEGINWVSSKCNFPTTSIKTTLYHSPQLKNDILNCKLKETQGVCS